MPHPRRQPRQRRRRRSEPSPADRIKPAITPFDFDGASIRVVTIAGEAWFVGKDVAEALGFKDTINAVKQHCRGVAKHHPIADGLGRMQDTRILSEPDVLRLIVNSTLPAAERFESWVFEDVLPAIRRTGAYMVAPAQPSVPALPGTYLEALEHLLVAKKAEQAAIEQRDEAVRTKAMIGSRREAQAMATASAAARESTPPWPGVPARREREHRMGAAAQVVHSARRQAARSARRPLGHGHKLAGRRVAGRIRHQSGR